VGLKAAISSDDLSPPLGMYMHTPSWAASRAPLAISVEDFDPCGCVFETPRLSVKAAAQVARARASGTAAAACAACVEKKVVTCIGKDLSCDAGASADKACVTYSIRSKYLTFADLGTDCCAEVGRVDIRYFQLFRDVGELLVCRVHARVPDTPVTVHVSTMLLLVHLGQLPRPSLPALIALLVWGLSKCAVATREVRQCVSDNL